MPLLRLVLTCAAVLLISTGTQAQKKISEKELGYLSRGLKETPLLLDADGDFKASGSDKWNTESAVIICQKTTFDFDKKGVSVGKRIGRNIVGLLLAVPTLGTSIWSANAHNETSMLVEERERRKILLRDKYALENFSVLYFRLSREGDIFAARVIKKDGSAKPVSLTEAIHLDDSRSVPSMFRSYTEKPAGLYYRPDYYKIAVPDLEEGDVIEYEFLHLNNREYLNNPSYKEFDPVYYLCNREFPVGRQIIEVKTQDENYHIGYKSLKGAPDFQPQGAENNKVYRWDDRDRDKLVDTRYLNEKIELPSIKFQVIYTRNSSKNFIWFADENAMKQDITPAELSEKARTFWFSPGKLQSAGGYTDGLKAGISSTADDIYRQLKKAGVTVSSGDEFAQKAYYSIRGLSMENNWDDYAYAKVMANLLDRQKLDYEIVATTRNNQTESGKVAFTQEIAWVILFNKKYYVNPGDHLNPEEIPAYLAGNTAVKFGKDAKSGALQSIQIPVSDTASNIILSDIKCLLDSSQANLLVEKETTAKGFMKDALIDEILIFTPFMENDYRNYDGNDMWRGLSGTALDKATEAFAERKKEWKEEKPKQMKEVTEDEYGKKVEKYELFKLQNDGRSFKKRVLKYNEKFQLGDMTARAGQDIILSLPQLIGSQYRLKAEERNRTYPIDLGAPRGLYWNIAFQVPAGYKAIGWESLQQSVDNAAGNFRSTVKYENNKLYLSVVKKYKTRNLAVKDWSQLVEIIDQAYNFSQARVILTKE
ncbi:DUF3857 domain-containing protein [Flavihumibacter petaseus]|uniref:DUF3857 domain-containing protein n=1 Tax=Flavihumibacter petaseus NBRC 106054 TaxID=1220578 RepID=A0A0E9N5G8_9BACT|nr:DUF3857 domain-containing protein [Flavihumibacter petaseus]GAO44590.1 hypothetical protein FPE01S_03_06280 [Flavihumibacter petaseus NBRC 106054]